MSEDPGEAVSSLLIGHETIPGSVGNTFRLLSRLGVWFQFGRNLPATSCNDAARKRSRLGHLGIPLWDEMKSYLGEYVDAYSVRRKFLAHCRGDRELDLDRVRLELGAIDVTRLSSESAARVFGSQYGSVTSFLTLEDLVQLFDFELNRPLEVPGTVMTNAGDLTWSVEFDPAELVNKLPGARWAEIIVPTSRISDTASVRDQEFPSVGILTGNPSDSGLDLFSGLNSHLRKLLGTNSLGDVSMPRVVLLSSPHIGISMEMDRREQALRKALLRGVDELCAAGVHLIAHPAHSTHYFASDIEARAAEKGVRFLSMAAATADWLKMSGVREVALLGTRYVTDFNDRWSVYQGCACCNAGPCSIAARVVKDPRFGL